MPDSRFRHPHLLPRERHQPPYPPQGGTSAPGGEGPGATGGSRSGSGSSGSGREGGAPSGEDNPFAPPPEGTPDRPWQPRRPEGGQDGQDEGSRDQGGRGGPAWGSQWSDRQPGPSSDGSFGTRPRRPGGPEGPDNGGPGGQGGPGGTRWDPTDPAQRRARFALLSGMWAFFFSLFGWPSVALLLGALGLYWGVSALRAKAPRPQNGTPGAAPAPAPAPQPPGRRPQTTAAISGLVTASLALLMVATTFTAHLVYRDYYTCTKDALTTSAKKDCDSLLPHQLRDLMGTP
ncbi:hypothetical protein ACH4KC_11250 [Streptomyces griseoaurantiacus]|uniref:hypothetical protein n=1 Tax=Streptomyces griseoaurantiacus TaxID=68213 RepID=UPI00378ECBA5